MRRRTSRRPGLLRHYAMLAGLAAIGLAAAGYVIAHQGGGLSNPFAQTYELKLAFSAADGVVAGIGQPVDVAGVEVGEIVGVKVDQQGNALVTVQIDRSQLPQVYANAGAALDPITPLDDMMVELNPGRAPAPALSPGATLEVDQTTSPAQLSELLDAIDGDTRSFLASLIASLGHGTSGQGANLRHALLELGPTSAEARAIGTALAGRRVALTHLVQNLAEVTRAAGADGQLSAVVRAGDQTLQSVAAQDVPLHQAIAMLPGTLQSVQATLAKAGKFATELRPTVTALLPAVRRLPATLNALKPFATTTASVISKRLLPFVKRAQPVVGNLSAATPELTALLPHMTSALQVVNYVLNELGYNPNAAANGSLDEGGLFWVAWFAHNWNTAWDLGDANGAIGGAQFTANCQSVTDLLDGAINGIVNASLGLSAFCPASPG